MGVSGGVGGGDEGRRGEAERGRGGDGSGGQDRAVMDQPCLSSHNVENRMHGVYYVRVTRRRKASRLIVLCFRGVWIESGSPPKDGSSSFHRILLFNISQVFFLCCSLSAVLKY